ncbi:MAG: NrtA/SsuA/CpmA family ABC transporter substrate-binding protein [Polyangiaceae bacterium]
MKATLALWLGLFTAACNQSQAAVAKSEAQPVVIRFSDPGNAGVMAYARREGILERELAKVNAKIEWVPAAGAFSANFEAMNSGAINASGAAVSPIVGALAHNLPFKIFAISDAALLKQSGIVSPAGSNVKRVEDLVGKRVAVNQAAHGDYILLRALEQHGVPAEKVTRVPIQPPDAAAAFATGKIDAWATFGVFFTTAIRNGANVLVYTSQLDSDDVGVTSANAAVLAKGPRAFQVFLKVVQELSEKARREPEKFQNVFTDKGPTAVSGENLKLAIEETRATSIPRVPTAEDRERVRRVSKLLFDNKSIDREIAVEQLTFDIDEAAKKASTL